MSRSLVHRVDSVTFLPSAPCKSSRDFPSALISVASSTTSASEKATLYYLVVVPGVIDHYRLAIGAFISQFYGSQPLTQVTPSYLRLLLVAL